MKNDNMTILNAGNFFLATVIILSGYSCQKELYNPEEILDESAGAVSKYIEAPDDTFAIRAFYGHQGITPPSVGTVIFPYLAYDIPVVNKLAFMSAYTSLNGYGDSANTVKKNALNVYNGEFYNNNVNAQGNAWITVTPLHRPMPEHSAVSSDGNFAYDKFFRQSRQIAISVRLVNGAWEHCDTAANGQVTIYKMDKLNMIASESVETGLATKNGVQKLKNGQSETYLTFVNQRGFILQLPKLFNGEPVAWYPHLF